MKRLLTFTYLVLCTTFLYAQLTFLSRSTPEQEGLLSADMLAFLDTVMTQKDTDVHGLMVLRNGKVIAEKYNEPWAAQYGHTLYSCSKTFTGVAVGLAIEDSLLTLDTRLVDILPDMMPDSIAPGIDSITVEHLLTMTPGFPVDTQMRTVQNEWVKAYCSQVLASPPGTKFAYDSIDSVEYRAGNVPGSRVFGVGSFRLLLGSFENEEFGNYTRYTYYNPEACVVMKINGKTLVLSGKDAAETQDIYQQLLERTK